MPLTGRRHEIEELTREIGRAPQLVAEIAGERDPPEQHRHGADVRLGERQERELVEVDINERTQHLAGGGTRHREPTEIVAVHPQRHRALDTGETDLLAEPAFVIVLGRARAEHQEPLIAEHARQRPDREVANQATLMVEHRRQRQPTGWGNPVGEQTIEEPARPRPGELVFRVAGDLHQAHPGPHRRDLLGHHRERVRPSKGGCFERLLARALEPERLLEPIGSAEHGVAVLKASIER